MSFFSALASKKTARSAVLIDIGANSIAGAYASATDGEMPLLLYLRRVPIEPHADESHGRAMLRTLQSVGQILLAEGAPVLARTTGSGTADTILVSVDAPWQRTSVRTEYLEQKSPFTFSKSLVTAALARTRPEPGAHVLEDESIIGTILNGYETSDPYGKQVRRASIIVLMSLIDDEIAKSIRSILQSLYHTKAISTISGSSLRYQAMRTAFPHEHEALILDATGPFTSISLIRNDLFVSMADTADSIPSDCWIDSVTKELAELAKRYPLPRTIFLVAREPAIDSLERAMSAANLGTLWLSDNPPKVVPVLASHLSGLIRQPVENAKDVALALMVLYWHRRSQAE